MDIHAPERPIESLRDFAIHICVVTVGILIALALEGLREAVHDHHLVQETRASMREEMSADGKHATEECTRISAYSNSLKAILALPRTADPAAQAEVRSRLAGIENPGYFFSGSAWTVALSTGALSHVSTEEAASYAYAAEGIRRYTELQTVAQTQEDRVQAYFASLPQMTPAEAAEGYERLQLFTHAEQNLNYVCPQMKRDIEGAFDSASR